MRGVPLRPRHGSAAKGTFEASKTVAPRDSRLCVTVAFRPYGNRPFNSAAAVVSLLLRDPLEGMSSDWDKSFPSGPSTDRSQSRNL